MLFTTKVANTQSSLCIQHSNDPSKPSIASGERPSDDDSSSSSQIDAQAFIPIFSADPGHQTGEPQGKEASTTRTVEEPLPQAVIPLKPRAQLPGPDFVSDLPSTSARCIRKPEFRSALPLLPQPELSLPSSSPSEASDARSKIKRDQDDDDSDDVPDLIPEDYNRSNNNNSNNDCAGNADRSPRSSWPAHGPPVNHPGLTSCLKKSKRQFSSHAGCVMNKETKPSSSLSSAPGPSSLRLAPSSLRKRPTTQRRVRGLWNVDSSNQNKYDRFEELRDETLEHIFSFLDLAELCRAGMVGRRWKSVVDNSPSLWRRIDATSFVQKASETFQGDADKTGQAMEAVLKRHKPESLVIRDIHRSLSADSYLPSITSIKELTLTHFENLTDTHVHVMLLMTLKKQSNDLQVLKLEECPRLTNAAIRSITATCTNLAHLSLKGNHLMDDISPLAPLLATKQAVEAAMPAAAAATPASLASLQAFFSPPAPITPPRPPVTPPRPSTPTNTSSLQSLFAPPGMSPPRKSTVILQRQPSTSAAPLTANNLDGKLSNLNIQGTKITAQSLVQCLKKNSNSAATTNNSTKLVAQLKSLSMNGDTWTDSLMGDFSQLAALEELISLDLSTAAANTSKDSNNKQIITNNNIASLLTNKGLKALARNATPRFSKLSHLDLSGHTAVTGMGLASLVSHSASPNLQTLCINHGHGVASDPKGMDRLVKALTKNKECKHLELFDVWSISKPSCNPALQMKEYQCWQSLIQNLSELDLTYLNVQDCWTTSTTTAHPGSCADDDVKALLATIKTVLY